MRIALIFLTLDRVDLTKRVIEQNFYNAGYKSDCFLIDNGSKIENFISILNFYKWHFSTSSLPKRGIASAVNLGLRLTKEYDAVCVMANDILLPPNWLQSWVTFYKSIPKTGIIGIHCVEDLPPLVDGVHKTHTPFGNNFISRDLVNEIGGYNTEYDPYGMQDSDYAERAIIAGYVNYYVPNLKSEHIGHDVGQDTDYRREKDASLLKAQSVWDKYKIIYHKEKKIRCEF